MITEKRIEATLGVTMNHKLNEPAFTIGSKLFTRRQLIEEVGVASFYAATRLQKTLKRLKISTFNQLYKLGPFALIRCRGIGMTSMFVAMCLLDYEGYDVVKWWGWDEKNTNKFSAFKYNAMHRASKYKVEV